MTQDIYVPTEVKAHYIMARTDAELSLLSHNCTGVGHKAQGAKFSNRLNIEVFMTASRSRRAGPCRVCTILAR